MAQPLSEDPLYGVGEPEFDPDKIEFRKFGTTRRGYSPDEVRPYLAAVADALRDSQRREGEMRSRLGKAIRRADQAESELEAAVEHLAEVQAQSSQTVVSPHDVTDAELTERLGEQVAQVLHAAREAAETRVSQAQLRAREMFEAAEAEVTDIRWRAELVYGEKTAEAEAAANEIITAAQQDAANIEQEADDIVTEARVVANDLLVAAQVEGEGLIQQAQEARFQILADMDRKRRTMRSQAERLKAGRDRLMQSHGVVQDTLNEIANELRISVAEAKIKGDTAAREVEGEDPAGPEALHSEIADAALIGTISLPEVERYEESDAAHKADAFTRTGELAALRGELVEVEQSAADEVALDEAALDDAAPEDEGELSTALSEDVVWAPESDDNDVELETAASDTTEVDVEAAASDTTDTDRSEAELAAAIEELEAAVAEDFLGAPPVENVQLETAAVEGGTAVAEAAVESEPIVESEAVESPAEPPAVEDAAVEDAAVEDAAIEDTLLEEVVIEVPAVEEAVIEDAVAEEAVGVPVVEAVEEAAVVETVVADVDAAVDTRQEARIIRVVDPRDSIRVLDGSDGPEPAVGESSSDEASAVDPATVDLEAVDPATVDLDAVAIVADATAIEVVPVPSDDAPVEGVAEAPEGEAAVEEVHNPMDSLFDRLRSKRDGSPESDASADTATEAESTVVERVPAASTAEVEAPEPEPDPVVVEPAAVAAPTEVDDRSIVEERDAAIDELQGTIERRLKRVLADEQNHVLEAINDRKRKTSVLEAMPPADTHADMYVAAIVPQIEACFRAGAAFANPLATAGIPNNGPFVESIAAVIDPLRAMISELAETPEDIEATATVRTFYRTFKKDELAIAASAIAVQAFSLGSTAALDDGAPVRWAFFDHEEGCPDGYDNSLSPAQPVGEQFPSGVNHPPTSPRCRCVLVPADR